MSRLTQLLRSLASMGLRKIDASDWPAPTGNGQSVPPPSLPAEKLRLHLFGASFDTQAEADRFCYEAPQPDYPEPLTRELADAYINTDQVEVICGPVLPRLKEFLTDDIADDVMLRLGADNSLIIITELAFNGMPYSLDDTDSLTYLGPIIVDI